MSAPQPPSPTSASANGPAAGAGLGSAPISSQPGSPAASQEQAIPAPAPQTPAAAARPAARASPSTAQQPGPSAAAGQAASAQHAAELQVVQMWRNLADTISPAGSRQAMAEMKQHLLAVRNSERYASLDDESKQWLQKTLPHLEGAEQAIKCMDGLINEAEDVLQPQQPQRAPGGDFLGARLSRAAALLQPGPDEAAFLECVQLCREVCELLPLAPSGRPALPSLEPDSLHLALELALAKLWRAMYLLPPECSVTGDTDPWPAVVAYLQYRTATSDFALIDTIIWACSRGSGRGSCGIGTPCDSSADGGSGSGTGPHGVAISSALRLALLCASWGRSLANFTLGKARLLRAAVDIASAPACAAAIDSRLAELAASQPTHCTPLQLTANQLCCACCVSLADDLHISSPDMPMPTPANQHQPTMRMSAEEIQGELRAAVQAGIAGLLQLEPQEPRTLLLAASGLFLSHHGASVESVEQCLQALQAARQQGSKLSQIHASSRALIHTMTLLMVHEGSRTAGQAGGSGCRAGTGAIDSLAATARNSSTGSTPAQAAASRPRKQSGKGAGAARRQQRKAAKQFEEMQQEAAAALQAAPSLPVATVEAVLEAFQQSGPLLKACKQVLPERWVRMAVQVRNANSSMAPGLQAFLEEARSRGSPAVRAGSRRMEAIAASMEAAVRSGDWTHIASVTDEFAMELKSLASVAQSAAYIRQHTDSLTPVCSGCGAVAVGLRKCSACKRAQYCSLECQKRHWPSHRAECRAAAGGASGSRGS